NSCFDAAQYSFFGKAPMEGAELGGLLEGGVDGDGGGFGGHDDAGYQFSSTGEEIDCMSNLSEIDDLASTFAMLFHTFTFFLYSFIMRIIHYYTLLQYYNSFFVFLESNINNPKHIISSFLLIKEEEKEKENAAFMSRCLGAWADHTVASVLSESLLPMQ
ncbi:hypothetical protein ACJX0J_029630, partial [Zea mays]